MADLAALSLEFLKNLNKSIRATRVYAPGHPQAVSGMKDAFTVLQKMLEVEPSIILGTREGLMIVQNAPIREANPAIKSFCELLSNRNISAFSVTRDVTLEEFGHLSKLLGLKPEDLLQDEAIKPELLEPLHAIRVNEMKFVAVKGDVADGDVLVSASGGGMTDGLSGLVASLLGGGTGAPLPPGTAGGGEGAGGGAPGAGNIGASALKALAGAIGPSMGQAQQEEALKLITRSFDQIVERSFAGLSAEEFLNQYMEGMKGLPEGARKALLKDATAGGRDPKAFVERLPVSLRGRLVAEDLLKGRTPVDKLRGMVGRLSTSSEDLVRLLEVAGRLIGEAGGTPEEGDRRLKELFQLMPLSDELRVKRSSILFISGAAADRESISSAVQAAGYLLTESRQADSAVEALIRSKSFDALLADVSTRRFAELRFLSQLEKDASTLPVILLENPVRVRAANDVVTYGSCTFLYKPVTPEEVVAALEAAAPHGQATARPAEDLERAREIQRQLQPRELPNIPGYAVAARHEPARDVGGDFHDVMGLPGGRFGILVADVSGTGTATAMAVAVVRSAFHRAAPLSATPLDTVVRANGTLAGELPRGLFVRAIYGVLEPEAGKLTLVGCGMPRPLLWSRMVGAVRALDLGGVALGAAAGPELPKSLKQGLVVLKPGDAVILHSAGATESTNPGAEAFGLKRLAEVIQAGPQRGAAEHVVEALEAVMGHCTSDTAPEEMTFLVLQRPP